MSTQRRPHAAKRRNAPALFGSRTDIGCVREHNEDSLIVAPPLFAVADGMGGHAAGEIASEVAVRSLANNAPKRADTEALSAAVMYANYAVIDAARQKGRTGMGTTLTAAILDGERLALAQVGDSRAYLLHHGHMQQLTRDHSLMADMIEAGELTPEEARVHPQRSVITRALGSDPNMRPDLYEISVSPGDRLLLCSDGLTTMLDDDKIERLLLHNRDPQRCAALLVNEAISAGGHDNITVVVVDIEGNAARTLRRTRIKGRLWGIALVLAFIAVVAGVCFGTWHYTQSTAYLTASDGKVAVYAGMPGSVMGIELSHLDHITDIPISKLQPGVASRLNEGVIRTDSLDAANKLVEGYQQDIATQEKHTSNTSEEPSADSVSNAPSKTEETSDAAETSSQAADLASSIETSSSSTN